jgi:hypothetical protein
MRLVPRLRTKVQLLLQVESSGFMIGLAILFVLVSLVQPFWSVSRAAGVDQDIGSFGWVTFTSDHFTRGTWSVTTILPYSSPGFGYPDTAGVAGNVYVLEVVYLVVLGLVLGLFRFEFSRKMPTANLLILSLVVLGVALFALFYPIVAIPAAATTDIGTFTVGGFWGSAQPAAGLTWSWGPRTRMVAPSRRRPPGSQRCGPALPEKPPLDGPGRARDASVSVTV